MKRTLVPEGRGLPPAGDERRDVLKARTDDLAEQAETDGAEGGAIDPKALRVENELAQHFGLDGGFNELDVSNKNLAYEYKWQQSGFYGRFVKRDLAMGWAVVGSMTDEDDGEAIELKAVDGTRRLGDVVLLRMRKDKFKLMKRREAAHRQAVQDGSTAALEELADEARRKHPSAKGLKVHTPGNMSEAVMKRLGMDAQAKDTVTKIIDRQVRDGRMPGVPIPAGA